MVNTRFKASRLVKRTKLCIPILLHKTIENYLKGVTLSIKISILTGTWYYIKVFFWSIRLCIRNCFSWFSHR